MSNVMDGVYQKIHSSTVFSGGDQVIVVRRVAGAVYRNDNSILDLWVTGMDKTVGDAFIVKSSSRDGVELDNGYYYPSCALMLKEKNMQTNAELVHNSNAFKIGDVVRIGRKTSPSNWGQVWDDDNMDVLLGKTGKVTSTSIRNGFLVVADGTNPTESYWYPSTSLQLVAPTQTPAAAPAKAKRRVRVGPGPWDQAPCPHLRWSLMAFFRDKLVLVKTVVRTTDTSGKDVEVELAQMDVACKKCNTKMTLKAR